MNENWDKERNQQCALDRKLLADIHTAVCGNPELGIPGLVNIVSGHGKDIRELKAIRAGGLVLSRAGSIIIGILVAFAAVGGFVLSVIALVKGKTP